MRLRIRIHIHIHMDVRIQIHVLIWLFLFVGALMFEDSHSHVFWKLPFPLFFPRPHPLHHSCHPHLHPRCLCSGPPRCGAPAWGGVWSRPCHHGPLGTILGGSRELVTTYYWAYHLKHNIPHWLDIGYPNYKLA